MSKSEARDRLSHRHTIARLMAPFELSRLIDVYRWRQGASGCSVYAVFVPSSSVDAVLARCRWDVAWGDGVPTSTSGPHPRYHRHSGANGAEPLVIARTFHDLHEPSVEISEEFRHFHNLFFNRQEDSYLKIDDGGEEHLVARTTADLVQVRLREILQFAAIKEMHLSIQFDCLETTDLPLSEVAGESERETVIKNGLACWTHYYGTAPVTAKHLSHSRILGKRLIAPLPKSQSGLWGFTPPQRNYSNFILGLDDEGREIIAERTQSGNTGDYYHESHPSLTPVCFSLQVLDKYYQQTSRFSVEDSFLRCGSIWGIPIDNHHDDKVVAWLGDLWRLPYQEQLHWRTHNIATTNQLSHTFHRRQIDGEFAESERIEHIFHRKYRELHSACSEQLGWQILLPLSDGDRHHIQAMRIPPGNEQRDFDELVLSLTKIVVDSLNVKELGHLPPISNGDIPPISRLEQVLDAIEGSDGKHHIGFLRKLQGLRSSGSAHRKGKKHKKAIVHLGVETKGLRSIFSTLLQHAVDFLDYLLELVRSGRLSEQVR